LWFSFKINYFKFILIHNTFIILLKVFGYFCLFHSYSFKNKINIYYNPNYNYRHILFLTKIRWLSHYFICIKALLKYQLLLFLYFDYQFYLISYFIYLMILFIDIYVKNNKYKKSLVLIYVLRSLNWSII